MPACLQVDLLICNAGILAVDELATLSMDSMRRQFEVNTLGPLRTVLAVKSQLKEGSKVKTPAHAPPRAPAAALAYVAAARVATRARRALGMVGHQAPPVAPPPPAQVAVVTSRMGSITDGSGGYYGYRVSKTAVNMAFSSLAHDIKSTGVAVGIVHPGFVSLHHAGLTRMCSPLACCLTRVRHPPVGPLIPPSRGAWRWRCCDGLPRGAPIAFRCGVNQQGTWLFLCGKRRIAPAHLHICKCTCSECVFRAVALCPPLAIGRTLRCQGALEGAAAAPPATCLKAASGVCSACRAMLACLPAAVSISHMPAPGPPAGGHGHDRLLWQRPRHDHHRRICHWHAGRD